MKEDDEKTNKVKIKMKNEFLTSWVKGSGQKLK